MSKPMTIIRIGELAWRDDKDVQELIAEVRRLRECIKGGAHENNCPASDHNLIGAKCSCVYKREALGDLQ